MSTKMTRRFFIGGTAALGAFGGCRLFKTDSVFRAGDKPRLKFGVVSDVHIIWGNTQVFVHTLEYFRDNGADAVMICGDIADIGLVPDLEAVAAAWEKVFPGNCAPDGRHVEKVFVTGNHDWVGHNYGNAVKKKYPDPKDFARNVFQTDPKGNWERIFNEPYSPVFIKDVKGYKFVGANWVQNDCNGRCEKFNPFIGKFYEDHAKEFDPSLPFFHAQHPHPKDTCYGPWAWGRDDGGSTAALKKFANAIAFSGHSHYPLTDERTVWQGDFTSIGTSSLSYSAATDEQWKAPGYDNYSNGDDVKVMPRLYTGDGKHGMLLSVYDDAIAISRREFVTDQPLGGDWVMPLPAAESKPFAYAERAKRDTAPSFAEGASVAVGRGKGKTRGNSRKKILPVEKDTYTLRFPAALSTDKTRAHEYELTFIGGDGRKAVRRLVAPGFHLPASSRRATEEVKCSIVADKLPAAPFKVEVRALSSFLKAGAPITGAFAG